MYDILLASASSALGGPVGWVLFLIGSSLYYGSLPKAGDIAITAVALFPALVAGVFGGTIVRVAVGRVNSRKTWAICWFSVGTVIGASFIFVVFLIRPIPMF